MTNIYCFSYWPLTRFHSRKRPALVTTTFSNSQGGRLRELVNVKKCKLFTHEAPKSSRNSFKGIRAFQVELEFSNVGFCGGRKTGEPGKNPRSRGENQQQTQPTFDAKSGNRTRAALVGGECSHHCAIPASTVSYIFIETITKSR